MITSTRKEANNLKKRVFLFVLAVLLIGAPIIASANAETDYNTVTVEEEEIMEAEYADPNNYALVGHVLLGWVAGHVLDAAWESAKDKNFSPQHLCVSLPPEINEQDVEEAFRR